MTIIRCAALPVSDTLISSKQSPLFIQEIAPMTLTFLGQKYESADSIPTLETNMTGLYRGAPVTFSGPRVVNRTSTQLTYRGVRYSR